MEKIGLTCSGGGIRALLFHLGVSRFLAKSGKWRNVAVISSVSGGSLFVALLLSANNGSWPNSDELLSLIDTKLKKTLTEVCLQSKMKRKLLSNPWLLLRPRASVFALLLSQEWKLFQRLGDLPDLPEIFINATTYETGKNWRFSKRKMGDYLIGYASNPSFLLSNAVAASAAYPGLIGPLKVQLKPDTASPWSKGSKVAQIGNETRKYWLWDGGVYENLGVEPLFKNKTLQKGIDFLIVSDASAPLGLEPNRWTWKFPFLRAAIRLTEIAMDQTRALRARDLLGVFSGDVTKGRYLNIARSCDEIYKAAKKAPPSQSNYLSPDQVRRCVNYPTNLKAVSLADFELIVRHGEEVAASTFHAWAKEESEIVSVTTTN